MGQGKFLRSLRQRWWLFLIIVAPVTLGVLIYTLVTPAKYEGFMTLADRRERDVNMAPIWPDQAILAAASELEIRVTNLANTIGSFTVLSQAYDELRVTGVLPQKEDDPWADRRRFISDVEIRPLRGSELLQVVYVDEDGERAQKVISVILKKFLERFRALNENQVRGQVKLIEEQLNEQRAVLARKAEEFRLFKERYPQASAYEAQAQGLVGRINDAKRRLAEAESNEVAARESLRKAREQAQRPEVKAETVVQLPLDPVVTEAESRLKRNLNLLESKKDQWGPQHPTRQQLEAAIESDRQLIAEAKSRYVPITTEPGISRAEEDRRNAVLLAERALAAATEQKKKAQADIAELQRELETLPVVEKEFTQRQAELLAQQEIVRNLAAKLQEAKVRLAENTNRPIFVLDDPTYRQLDRGTALKTLVAFFLSLIVAVSLIASLGQFDRSTYTAMEAENMLGFPVIGALPRSAQQRLNPEVEQPSPLAASYQILSTQIMAIRQRLNGPGVLVASAEADAGRTTVAANLAISLARDGARVLLVDADLRNPSLHEHFGLINRAGLAEILSGEASIEDVVQATGVEGLLFIGAGQPPVNPVRLFRSERMEELLDEVGKGADFLVLDSPSGGTFGDALVLAEKVQNVVLIHEAGRPPSEGEYEFHKALERLGVNIIGLVLNKTRPQDCPGYQQYTRSYASAIRRYHGAVERAALGPGEVQPKE